MSVVQSKGLENLQSLSVGLFELTLCETINLLASLPNLATLKCKESGLGHQFDAIPRCELADYVLFTYYPLSKTFRRWECEADSSSAMDCVALCAVLLAIACPQFSCTSVSVLNNKEYARCVANVVAEEPFINYRDLIQPLPSLDASID
ncbi:hypothetical protein GGI04_001301 [Coemansia thaxteri]|uniref:Uncharacterized protein n=1 Tax=Coemansia thaxteri TaxID=2663907 RepID=A0A9W8BCR4_9FUNG|nr:hypothetical protein H4R26_002541 [Coemansia thaxteri]KAJ2008028.1 hypothetical protein GGI04_001301 [Coemansia thaxteri]KAJ2482319.1 hypothetical protein EV174_003240 [Coemansia sp. RSA 2320]